LPVLKEELAKSGADISIMELFEGETVEGIVEKASFELSLVV
jgi:hypothetical protein